MFCPWCGVENENDRRECASCGRILRPEPGKEHPYTMTAAQRQAYPQSGQMPYYPPGHRPQYPPHSDDVMSRMIPSNNQYAMAAYYLAVFSLIPGIGLFLGIAAFFCGLSGLKYFSEHPEVHGRTHSLVGIILGGLTGWGSVVVVIGMVLMIILGGYD